MFEVAKDQESAGAVPDAADGAAGAAGRDNSQKENLVGVIDQLSSVLKVSKDQLAGVSELLLGELKARYEALEGDNTILNVKLRQAEKKSQGRVTSLDLDNQQLQELVKKYKEDNQEIEARNQAAAKEAYELHVRVNKLASENERLQLASQVNDEKLSSNVALISKTSSENLELKADLAAVKAASRTLRDELVACEDRIYKLNSESVNRKYASEESENKRLLVAKELQWYKDSLSAKTEEFNRLQQDKSQEVTGLRRQLDKASSDASSSAGKVALLEGLKRGLEQKLQASIVQYELSHGSRALEEEKFFSEISSKDKLIEILKQNGKNLAERLEQLDKQHGQALLETQEKLASSGRKIAAQQQEISQKLVRIEELEDAVGEGLLLDGKPKLLQDSPVGSGLARTPNASLSELYSEYSLLRKQYINERRLKEKLQAQIDGFIIELEQKIPLIETTNSRNQYLEKELAEMATLLENQSYDKKQLAKLAGLAKLEKNQLSLQVASLLKTKLDLSKQVQYLLIQLHMNTEEQPLTELERLEIDVLLNDYKASNQYIDKIHQELASNGVELTDVDALVTSRLQRFKNVKELQLKNLELSSIVRKLSRELEALAKSTQDEELESETIEEAKLAIKTLEENIELLEIKLGASERERDMYKGLTGSEPAGTLIKENGTGAGQASAEAELEDEIRSIKSETQAIVADLNSKIEVLYQEKSTMGLEVSSLKSTEKIYKERYTGLMAEFEYKNSELKDVKARNEELYNIIIKQDSKTLEVAKEIVNKQAEVSNLRHEFENLKVEKTIVETVKARLELENHEVKQERQKLNKFNEHLQQINVTRDKDYRESNDRLLQQLQEYKTEVSQHEAKLAAAAADLKDKENKLEEVRRISQNKYEKLSLEFSRNKELLSNKVTELEVSKNKVEMLERQKRYLEPREDGAGEDKQLEELEVQLSSAKEDLFNSSKDVEYFKDVASKSEAALNEMNKLFDQFKETARKELAASAQQVKSLTKEIEGLNQHKASSDRDIDEYKKQLEQYKQDVSSLTSKLSSDSSIGSEFSSKLDELRRDLQHSEAVKQELKASYEDQLTKHAAAVQASKLLKQRNQQLQQENEQYEKRIAEFTQKSQADVASWSSQKAELEGEIERIKSQIQEYVDQNHLLHHQLEAANGQGTVDVDGLSREEYKEYELRRIVEFVKKEKELVEQELHGKVLETQRLKIEVDGLKAQQVRSASENRGASESVERENQALLAQLNNLSVIRESNNTLRLEVQTKEGEVQRLEAKVQELSDSLRPLKEKLIEVGSELKVKIQENKLVAEDNENWKKRVSGILSSNDKIEAAEHDKLKSQYEQLSSTNKEIEAQKHELSSRIQRLKSEFQSKLQSRSKEAKEFRNEIETLKKDLEAKTSELDKEKEHSNKSSLKSKLSETSKLLQDSKNRVAELTKEKNALEARLGGLEELTKEKQELAKEVEALKKQEGKGSLAEDISQLREKFEQDKQDLVAKLTAEKQQEIEKLQASLEASKSEGKLDGKQDDQSVADLHRAWEAEQEPKVKSRIEAALDDLRSKLTAPTRQRIEQLANSKFEDLRKKHVDELKAEAEKTVKQTYEAKYAEREDKLVADLEAKVRQRVEEELKKQTGPDELKKLGEFLNDKNEKKIQEITKKHEQELAKQFSNGQKASSLKLRLLEGKIKKLTEQLSNSSNLLPTKESSGPESSPVKTIGSLSIPNTPVLPKQETAAVVLVSPDRKRQAEEQLVNDEKKPKTEGEGV